MDNLLIWGVEAGGEYNFLIQSIDCLTFLVVWGRVSMELYSFLSLNLLSKFFFFMLE